MVHSILGSVGSTITFHILALLVCVVIVVSY